MSAKVGWLETIHIITIIHEMITMSFIENETKVEKFEGSTQKLDIKKQILNQKNGQKV